MGTDDDLFSGKGFPTRPISDDEAAALRELLHEVKRAWPTLSGLDQITNALQKLAKVITVAAMIGASVAWAVQAGFFG